MSHLSRRPFLEKFSIGLGTTAGILTVPSVFNFAEADAKAEAEVEVEVEG